jgi:AAA+ superfamily predicted ATPase
MSVFLDQIREALRGRHPLLYLRTPEEDRVCETLRSLLPESFPGGTLSTWDCVRGLEPAPSDVDTRNPVAALQHIIAHPGRGFTVMKDLSDFMDDARVVRGLRDAYHSFVTKGQSCLVIVSPVAVLPATLEKELCLVDVAMPAPDELLQRALLVQTRYPGAKLSPELQPEISMALRGLTLQEVDHVMHRALGRGAGSGKELLAEIFAEKKVLAKKSGFLEYIAVPFDIERVGGLENVKDWAAKRKSLFTQDAVKAGLPVPRGVLMMGVSGCGKSMMAKAIASFWKVPLFRLDMNLVYSGIYGKPGAAFSRALATIEAVAPAVLWIDEMEAALSTPKDAGSEQSMMFSAFLTWMQEKPPLVFVAATANRIESLPAEIIRKGRFDQVFFCDLPTEEERRDIIKIHLGLNGADPKEINIDRILVHTQAWTGAEIEQAIISARIDAVAEKRRMATDDITRHTTSMVPLSKTMSEQIKAIRDWAFDRATRASRSKPNY